MQVMTNKVSDKSLSITVSGKELFGKLQRAQWGEKVEFNGNEYALLVDLNLLSSKNYAELIQPLGMLEEGIRHAHSNSSYGAGWFWGEGKWKNEIEEAKLTRASYLLGSPTYNVEGSELTPLGVSALKKFKEVEESGENPLLVLKLLSVLRDIGGENFRDDWFGLSESGNLRLTIAVVSALVGERQKRELICEAVQDLVHISPQEINKGTTSDLSLYLATKRYEDEFNLEIAVNSVKASLLKCLRDLAILQEKGKFSEDRIGKGENFELRISNPTGRPVQILKNLIEVTKDALVPHDLKYVIERLEDSKLKSELQTALDARTRLEENFKNRTSGGKLPVTAERAFDLMTKIAAKYLSIKTSGAADAQIEKSLKEAEEAVSETVKRLLEATESLNYEASNELRALAMALKSVVGAEI